MDNVDRRLLNLLQGHFPLTPQPFAEMGSKMGLSPQETLSRVQALKEKGLLRQISAIFDSRALGYQSTLATLRLPFPELDRAAQIISRHPGVSHNYSRNHIYNLWFTLTLPPGQDMAQAVAQMAREAGAQDSLLLPMVRQFKLDGRLSLLEEETAPTIPPQRPACGEPDTLYPLEVAAVRELQEDLPLEERPFLAMARRLGLEEAQLLDLARSLMERGIMRRYGGQVQHRRAGFIANAMGCWIVPPERVEEVGEIMSSFPQVTHCYQRPTYPDWPYNLFTMIHATTRAACEEVAYDISRRTGITDFILLFSIKEYKKVRVKYFA